jgi:hypothetical protein
MALRLSSSHCSGIRQIHRGRKKARQIRSNVKSMLTFFDSQGIVYKELVPPNQTVNDKFYCEGLKRLREGIRRKVQPSGRTTIRFSTMTTRQLANHLLFDNS